MALERDATRVLTLRSPDDELSGGDSPFPDASPIATGERRQMAASFQLNLDTAARIACPRCGQTDENVGMALNLTVGPIPDGMQMFLVRPDATLRTVVDDVRRALINGALERANGNQARAAKLLGMKYTTFHTLARRLGIVRRRSGDEPELDGSDAPSA